MQKKMKRRLEYSYIEMEKTRKILFRRTRLTSNSSDNELM